MVNTLIEEYTDAKSNGLKRMNKSPKTPRIKEVVPNKIIE